MTGPGDEGLGKQLLYQLRYRPEGQAGFEPATDCSSPSIRRVVWFALVPATRVWRHIALYPLSYAPTESGGRGGIRTRDHESDSL